MLETFQALAETEKYRKVAFRNPNTLPCTRKEEGTAGVKIGKLSPVEFVLILVLIARHPNASDAKLARHILGLRDRVHNAFVGEKKYNKKLFDLYMEWEAAEFSTEGLVPVGGAPEVEADLASEEEETKADIDSDSKSESGSKGKKWVRAPITPDTFC